MANLKRAIRVFCNRGIPEFPSFGSSSYPSDPTEPGTIYMSDVYNLVRNIDITKPEYNIEKCQILKKACMLIASYYLYDGFTREVWGEGLFDGSVKELHRVLQQLKSLLEGYSAPQAWSPLVLLKADNTEAFIHLIDDLRCAFASVNDIREIWADYPADRVFKACSRERLERASWRDRSSILTNIRYWRTEEAKQIETSEIARLNYFIKKYVGDSLKNFPCFKGLVLQLDPQDLTIQRKIAETRYAQVYEGLWCGQIRVAIKTYIACYHDLCTQEASVHAKLNHPNIVQFIGVATGQDGNASSAVTELMSSTTLQDEMDNRREKSLPFTSLEAINIIIQIARGMSYLHRRRVMHRDLKPSNILICSCENCKCVGNMGSLHVKIADFGDAKTASSELGTPNVGTHRWMAPEVHSFNRRDPSMKAYTCQADVYSFGILCYEIVTGKLPFTGVGTKEYYQRIGAGERPELPAECSEGLARLIKSCWVGEATQRPDFIHICDVLQDLRQVEIFGETVNPPCSDETSSKNSPKHLEIDVFSKVKLFGTLGK